MAPKKLIYLVLHFPAAIAASTFASGMSVQLAFRYSDTSFPPSPIANSGAGSIYVIKININQTLFTNISSNLGLKSTLPLP